MFRTPSAILFALVLPACTSVASPRLVGRCHYQLIEVTAADGSSRRFDLQVEPSGRSLLLVTTEADESYPSVGLGLAELDKREADQRSLRPYSGLLVMGVEGDSPADQAGVESGAVLLSLNGESVYYQRDYRRVLEGTTRGEPVEFEFIDPQEGNKQLVPEFRTRRVKEVARVALEKPESANPVRYAGVSLRSVPVDYVREIYGDSRNMIIISQVDRGSPAYLAGLRSGDIIQNIDGSPPPDLEGFMSMLNERGSRGDTLFMEVGRGGSDTFSTDVELADYARGFRAHVPAVFDVRSDPWSTSWELVWGWVMDYENRYTYTPARRTTERGHFSTLFGLYDHRWGESGSRVRLLWFITFG